MEARPFFEDCRHARNARRIDFIAVHAGKRRLCRNDERLYFNDKHAAAFEHGGIRNVLENLEMALGRRRAREALVGFHQLKPFLFYSIFTAEKTLYGK